MLQSKHWLGLRLCLASIASKKLLKPASVQSVSLTGGNSCVSVLRIEPSTRNKALLGLLKLCGFGSGFGMGMSLGGNVFSVCSDCGLFIRSCGLLTRLSVAGEQSFGNLLPRVCGSV